MKIRLMLAAAAVLALLVAPALSSPKKSVPGGAGTQTTAPVAAAPLPAPPPAPAVAPAPPAAAPEPVANVPNTVPAVPGATPIGSPTIVTVTPPAPPSGGFIQIGKIFGETMQPYIDAFLQALAFVIAGWIATLVGLAYKRMTGKELEAKDRDALQRALTNQAAGLLQAGAVQMRGLEVHVASADLANAANKVIGRVPDAFKNFGLTPEVIQAKVLETIPQTEAGAAIIAQAHAEAATEGAAAAMPPASSAVSLSS